ncbi:tRNA (cytidine/uridine-2'-O-)-methyltransferase TrmJ [Sideroxyarcus emersonii]|uniref:tRNA (cytidine/uridine-2'-O-)-methyltransferase TrmJ n=1 Tax=Sideroxyarcus emersonii TaxID=2764705 RepID=A0AAN2BZI5_9PROT|nr:tRNA (cytidine/uridine-2'-O-)-methyltransferase TrmJ [Sideroxyarcus emersonii]
MHNQYDLFNELGKSGAYFSWYCVLNKPNPLSGIRVVLSHTTHPGNIGAAARAMKTMGLRHLYLINPRHFPDAQATAMAAGADDILQDAVVCGSIDEALQGVVFTVAMTARLRDISIAVRTPREAMPQLLQEAQAGPVALLFGTEMSGLTNEEMGKAQLGVNIPANPEFSSLNVAAAVQVMAYELVAAAESFVPRVPQIEPATHERLEGLYAHLEKTLFEIGFFTTQNPARLMQRLRRLYSRTRLEDEEINILRGMLTVATEYNARLKKRYAEEHPDVQQH